jgi:phage baseplate assembly protein W
MANLTKVFSDIDLTFTRKPAGGDIALSYDSQAVIRSVRNLIQTNHYERLFNPDLGSSISTLLFENISPLTGAILEREIKSVIDNYEPRASVSSIVATPDYDRNGYNVTITFFIQNLTSPTTITVILQRNR